MGKRDALDLAACAGAALQLATMRAGIWPNDGLFTLGALLCVPFMLDLFRRARKLIGSDDET